MNRPTIFKLALLVCFTTALNGCAAAMLKKRASFDLQCPQEELQLHNTGPGSKGVTGCGQQATYVLTDVGWVLNSDARAAPSSEPANTEASSSPPSPTGEESAPANQTLYSTQAPDVDFPEDAAGFLFASSPAEARAACEGAGHEWTDTEKGANCSGLPKDVGVPGQSQVRFCGGKLCRLGAAVVVEGDQLEVPLAIWGSLNKKYGKPVKSRTKVPRSCSNRMFECIQSGEAVMDNTWRWNDDSKIVARFETKAQGTHLLLYYVQVMEDAPDEGSGVADPPKQDFSDSF